MNQCGANVVLLIFLGCLPYRGVCKIFMSDRGWHYTDTCFVWVTSKSVVRLDIYCTAHRTTNTQRIHIDTQKMRFCSGDTVSVIRTLDRFCVSYSSSYSSPRLLSCCQAQCVHHRTAKKTLTTTPSRKENHDQGQYLRRRIRITCTYGLLLYDHKRHENEQTISFATHMV